MGACNTKDGISEPKTKKQSAFKSCDELKDFDTFFPAGTTSSLCKNMTKEIWEEYKDMSDDSGVSFKVCVFSGIQNLDSGIGVYAGSHSSYTKFSKLFDKVSFRAPVSLMETTKRNQNLAIMKPKLLLFGFVHTYSEPLCASRLD